MMSTWMLDNSINMEPEFNSSIIKVNKENVEAPGNMADIFVTEENQGKSGDKN